MKRTPSQLVTTVAVGAVFHGRRILLLRRNFEPFVGCWGMPGGKIHSGEHIEEAVEREVLEECGIRTRFQRFCGVLSEKVENRDATVFAPKTGGVPVFHYIVLVSRLTALTSRITPSREGEVRWFPLANLRQLRKLMIPSDYLMLQRFVLRRSSRPYYRCTIGIGVHPRSSAVAGRYLVRRFY